MTKCIGDFNTCTHDGPVVRGLCRRCYSAARARVASSLTTWEELEKLGMSLPATKVSGPRGSGFDKLLAERRQAAAAAGDPLDKILAEDLAESLKHARQIIATAAGTVPPDETENIVADPEVDVALTEWAKEQPLGEEQRGVGGYPVAPGYTQDGNANWERCVETGVCRRKLRPSLRERSLAAVAAEPPELPTPERAAEIAAGEALIAAQKADAAGYQEQVNASVSRFVGGPVPAAEVLAADLSEVEDQNQKILPAIAAQRNQPGVDEQVALGAKEEEGDFAGPLQFAPGGCIQPDGNEIGNQGRPILKAAAEHGIGSIEVAREVQAQTASRRQADEPIVPINHHPVPATD